MARHGLRPGKILWEVQEAYQPGVVREKLTRGPLEYGALWKVAQRMTDRPVKFGAICAPALASMLWNEFYLDDKAMVRDLCDIMNAEFRDMVAAGCVLIQVEEPRHHMRAQQDDCTALIRKALEYIPKEQLVISTDCGFGREGLSRRIAFYKCVALVEGTNFVRRELGLPEARVRAADPKLWFAEREPIR